MLIGKKIKELRKARKMKLIELADKTGIQIATLSRIEHEKMTGTLPSHIKIAEALGVELTELYHDLVKRARAEPESTTEKSETETFTYNQKASYEILVSDLMSRKMMPVIMHIEPGGKTTAEQNRPGTERFVLVLQGAVTAHVGEKDFALKQNNSLYFDASVKHWFENTKDKTARFVSVTSPVVL